MDSYLGLRREGEGLKDRCSGSIMCLLHYAGIDLDLVICFM